MSWDPEHYLTFADERGRPFVDLVNRIGAAEPATVMDLGCGPGNLTAALKQRWPDATVRGLDSSAEMIATARAVEGIEVAVGDLRSFTGPVDVLVSNATLQWLPDHLALLPSLVAQVNPGGWFAFQVPGNFDEPSHTIRRDLAAQAPYADHTAGAPRPDSHDPATYLRVLAGLGCTVDAWETTYLHVLTGPDPVFAWVSSTGARTTLEALEGTGLRPAFEAEFKRRLAQAYPDEGYGVVLPFRRIFVVARVPA
ncbi:methyltransferase domain-containing protein [Nocardioides sp.]|uniref:methyltransferase domain-containing protein n=1 Tax=Nocardioides sp. TaxID=35761 RepID=UPI003D116F35